jgi:hypothetical protein
MEEQIDQEIIEISNFRMCSAFDALQFLIRQEMGDLSNEPLTPQVVSNFCGLSEESAQRLRYMALLFQRGYS